MTKVDPVIWTGSMRNWVLSYFWNGHYQVEIASQLNPVASTCEAVASIKYPIASTDLS